MKDDKATRKARLNFHLVTRSPTHLVLRNGGPALADELVPPYFPAAFIPQGDASVLHFDPQWHRTLISGNTRGVAAMAWRGLLRLGEIPYGLVTTLRNWHFDRRPQLATRVNVPVISVGNITTGGTGKTPLVAWLAQWFRRQGVRVSIVSRGYGAEHGGWNDEALELEQRLPDVPHVQNPNRVEAATVAIEELATQLILLDDAFQHRRIARDLDLVLLDALEPFGYGHLLPRGLLRESLSGLRRADVVVLSRADLVSAERRDEIRRMVATYAPRVIWVEARHAPRTLLSANGETRALDQAGPSLAAFCGIGNPAGFRATLQNSGLKVTAWREFPDHYRYQRADVESLAQWLNEHPNVSGVVCTQKDLVKIGLTEIAGRPLWALSIDLELMHGAPELEAKLQTLVDRIEPEA